MDDSDDEAVGCECLQQVLQQIRNNAMTNCMAIIEGAASIGADRGRVDISEAMCLVSSLMLEVVQRAHGTLEERLASLDEMAGVVRAGVVHLDGRVHDMPAGTA